MLFLGILYSVSALIGSISAPAFLFLFLLLAVPLIWLSAVDWTAHIIPDMAVVGVGLSGLCFVGFFEPEALLTNVVGAVVVGGVLWLSSEVYFRRTGRDGLGLGDVKLIASGTLIVGPLGIAYVVLLASVAGIFSILLVRFRPSNQNPDQRPNEHLKELGLPFAPYLAYALFLVTIFQAQSL